MTRYSALLWGKDIRLLKDAWKTYTVNSNREVWWEDTVYRREGPQTTDTLIHIVNPPELESVDLKVATDPHPARHVEVEFPLHGSANAYRAGRYLPMAIRMH